MHCLPPRVFIIGSSTTLLFGPYLKRMLAGVYRYGRKGEEPEALARALADLDTPQGASAGDSAMVLDYLAALERAGGLAADVVLMHVGAHDIKRRAPDGEPQVSRAEYGRNVEAIVAWFRCRGIPLIWIRSGPLDETLHNARSKGILRFEADLDAYNATAEATLNREGIPVLDLPGFTRRLGPLHELLKDHIHFQDDVVRLQAAFIAGCLAGVRATPLPAAAERASRPAPPTAAEPG